VADVVKVNTGSFEAEVMQSATPVLVDFGAPWCGPCKQLDPIMDELAASHGERLKIVKVDIQESPDVAMKFGVMAVPTLLFMKSGQVEDQVTGNAPSKAELEKRIGSFLG
jgi:thioredoxin 1